MSYYYDVAIAINVKDLPNIIRQFILPESHSEDIIKFFDAANKTKIYEYNNEACLIFKWDMINHYDRGQESDILYGISQCFDVDYMVVTEEDEIIHNEQNIGLLERQNTAILAPDDMYLQRSWRAIKGLKKYIKENCNISDEEIEQIIKDANMIYFDDTY